MKIHKLNSIKYLTLDSFDKEGIKHGFFTRHGGVSPTPWKSMNLSTTVGDSKENVVKNRIRILSALELEINGIFDVWQIHSTVVIVANKPRGNDEIYIQADAVICAIPKVTLLMRFADCVPILLFDSKNKVIGLIHSGWMGTLNQIAKETVNKMEEVFGSNPNDIIAGIGPSISVDHYEIGPDVVEKTKNVFPKVWGKIIKQKREKNYLDLWKANSLILNKAGVNKIEIANICTACNTTDWYSHRGEDGKTGRFGAVISLSENN